jgi:hypothetical protein
VATSAAKKDYAAIAASKITSPSQSSAGLPSILIYARNKKGKTRFGTTAGKGQVLIADPENGTKLMTKRDPHVWHIHSWSDLDDLYKYLRSGKHDYKWVDLDGLTRMSNMALRFVMAQAEEHDLSRKPGMVQKQDYGKAGELMKGMLYNFHNLPMGLILSAQERQIDGTNFDSDDDDSEDAQVQFVPDLPKGVRAAVNGIVDVIGRLYTVKIDKDDDTKVVQRRLWLEPSVMYDTGYRSDYVLPPYLANPTVPKLVQLINEGKVTNNGNGNK